MLYKLNRFSRIHTILRKIAYSILWNIPASLKYPLFQFFLKGVKPYSLLKPGDVVIQIGAPWDILKSGRSRALHFALKVGNNGHVYCIEPVAESVYAMRKMIQKLGIHSMTQIESGAWSHKDTLSFLISHDHPASNLVDTVFDESRTDSSKFDRSEISVDSLSNLLEGHVCDTIKLLSITTNGSEPQILSGVDDELLRKIEYVSVIDDPRLNPAYADFGFEYAGEDDRGYLVKNSRYAAEISG